MAELRPTRATFASCIGDRNAALMDTGAARRWLDQEWAAALSANHRRPDPEIDQLANSEVVAVRYALVTQLLGKIGIGELVHSLFVLMDETWRVPFVREIGRELDRRRNQAARKHWHDLLLAPAGQNRGI